MVEEVAGSQETESDGEQSDQASMSDPLEHQVLPDLTSQGCGPSLL